MSPEARKPILILIEIKQSFNFLEDNNIVLKLIIYALKLII